MTPELPGTAVYTVYITENGFNPAVLSVPPGSIIEWVNADLTDHAPAATDDTWKGGVLQFGESFRTRLDAAGTYPFADETNPLSAGTIIVEGNYSIFLPVITH